MDENLKRDFEAVCSEMGLTMTAAFTVFAKKVALEKEIPFKISTKRRNQNDFSEEFGLFPGKRLSVEETAGIAKEWADPSLLDINESFAWEQVAVEKEQQRQEEIKKHGVVGR
jgi:antitoxin component of RelBE/YafQ-DinJ toxin-antitoxin module